MRYASWHQDPCALVVPIYCSTCSVAAHDDTTFGSTADRDCRGPLLEQEGKTSTQTLAAHLHAYVDMRMLLSNRGHPEAVLCE